MNSLITNRWKRITGSIWRLRPIYMDGRIPDTLMGQAILSGTPVPQKKIMITVMELYTKIADPDLLIRRVNIAACGLIPKSEIPEDPPEQLSLFVNYEALEKQRESEKKSEEKERKLQRAMLE